MSVYLDTNVLVGLVRREATTDQLQDCLAGQADPTISDWTALELSSALAVQQRMGLLAAEDRAKALAGFAGMRAGLSLIPVERADHDSAARLIDSDRIKLRAPDALHLAIVRRLGIPLATLDKALEAAAVALGVVVVELATNR